MPVINKSEATKRSKDRKIYGKCTNGTNRRSRVWPVCFIYIIATTQQCLVASPRDPGVVSLHVNAGHFSTTARRVTSPTWGPLPPCKQALKHGAILYNEAEVFSLSITNPSGRPMLPLDWLIHSSLILASCHRILFLCRFSAVGK